MTLKELENNLNEYKGNKVIIGSPSSKKEGLFFGAHYIPNKDNLDFSVHTENSIIKGPILGKHYTDSKIIDTSDYKIFKVYLIDNKVLIFKFRKEN